MRRLGPAIAVVCAAIPALVLAYEWKSHNRMAWNARDVFLGREPTHKPPYPVDESLLRFLDQYGEDLDTRAGDVEEPPLWAAGTDEDSMEGELVQLAVTGCHYSEDTCGVFCTGDHFHPPLQIPVAGEDAYVHAKRYFDWAVKLFKAGICRPGARSIYHKWAARALGHAIHLVHDDGLGHQTASPKRSQLGGLA